MLSYEATSAAPPAEVWSLLAEPERWHEWSPHVRGAWGLGAPEVREGARGAARLLWAVPIPAVVTEVRPRSSWSWKVGPVTLVHHVRPAATGTGSVVGTDLVASPALEALLRVSYGPWTGVLMQVLAKVAERGGR